MTAWRGDDARRLRAMQRIRRRGNRVYHKHLLLVNMPSTSRKDLNVSRRLKRMLKASGLPRVGQAHVLRMRYVQVIHVLLILQLDCTLHNIVNAMRELLEGWSATEEKHSRVGGYQHRLLNVVDDIHTKIEQRSWGEWNDVDE
jgi:hypothetical protein